MLFQDVLPVAFFAHSREVVVGLLRNHLLLRIEGGLVEGSVHAERVESPGVVDVPEGADAGHLGRDVELSKGPAGGEVLAGNADRGQGAARVQPVVLHGE